MLRRLQLSRLIVLSIAWLVAIPAFCAQTAYTFDIPAQSLAEALREVGKRTNTNILFEPALVKGLKAPPLRAELTADEAVRQLLDGTELRGQRTSVDTIVVRNGSVGIAATSADTGSSDAPVRYARSDAGAVSLQKIGLQADEDTQSSRTARSSEKSDPPQENEVVVTGTNIRGVPQSATPVLTYAKEEIEKTGFTTVEQFVQSLSQNFRSGVQEYGGYLDGSIRSNRAMGNGINLRGLGNDSTLVLINGRRVAPSNNGENIDISMIPLAAVQRIDVLTDGASAIYGSEAIGGVVNFILRDDYDGAETRLRYSDHTSGHARKYEFDQVFGKKWDSGNALFSFNMTDRNALDVKARAQTSGQDPGNAIVGEREDMTFIFTGSQHLSPRVTVYLDGIYADRDFTTTSISGGGFIVQHNVATVKQTNALAGGKVDLGGSWQLDMNLSVGKTKTTNLYNMIYGPYFIDPYLSTIDVSELNALEAKVDGVAFKMPGGDARLALNGQYREQKLDSPIKVYAVPGVISEQNYFDVGDRNVKAFAAEMFFPLVGAANSRPLLNKLEFTLAGRVEEYDVFGSTKDPKFGLLWSPVEGLDFRSTWGTSFRAPLLGELTTISQGGAYTYIVPAPNDPGGQLITLYVSGNDPNVRPETATSFTVGMDYKPEWLSGAKMSLTYYDIDFKDRIANPLGNSSFLDVFINENLYGSTITRANQAGFQDLINRFATGPFFQNLAGVPLNSIQAVVDMRLDNVSIHRQSGVDYNIDYAFDTRWGAFQLGLAGTYIFKFGDKLTPTSPFEDTTSTVTSPIDFKINTTLSWAKGPLSASTMVLYADNYRDTRATIPAGSNRDLASWTTVNFNINYDMPSSNEWLSGIRWTLNVNNAFDRMPPFVYGYGVSNFDGTNADVLGRYVSLGVTKSWR